MLQRIIIFGASGDLTARLLLPALAQLRAAGQLPAGLSVVGSALEPLSSAAFRAIARERLAEHARFVAPQARESLVECISYQPGSVTDAADVARIIGTERSATLIYLALPTGIVEAALLSLAQAGLGRDDAIAIEKPFGVDLEAAQRLNRILDEHLHGPSILRVDHFLSDELVRRVLALRFMNRVFEPTLNGQHVAAVEISWLESLALEGRAGYYDRAGAMKDMIQNHLLEALSLVIMHQPARLDDGSFRGARVEALRAIRTPTAEEIRATAVRGRYSAGTIGARQVPAYVDEPGVEADRSTETYASVELPVTAPRWAGTRFLLRSGKAMGRDKAEVAIHYHHVASYMDRDCQSIAPNVLRIGLLEPYVRLEANVNRGDFEAASHPLEMLSQEPARTAYANLILEMLRGRSMLFIRGDEAEEAWRICDPIARAFQDDVVPLHEYPAGSMRVG